MFFFLSFGVFIFLVFQAFFHFIFLVSHSYSFPIFDHFLLFVLSFVKIFPPHFSLFHFPFSAFVFFSLSLFSLLFTDGPRSATAARRQVPTGIIVELHSCQNSWHHSVQADLTRTCTVHGHAVAHALYTHTRMRTHAQYTYKWVCVFAFSWLEENSDSNSSETNTKRRENKENGNSKHWKDCGIRDAYNRIRCSVLDVILIVITCTLIWGTPWKLNDLWAISKLWFR